MVSQSAILPGVVGVAKTPKPKGKVKIDVWVDPAHKALWEDEAEAAGIALSAWIRSTLNAAAAESAARRADLNRRRK